MRARLPILTCLAFLSVTPAWLAGRAAEAGAPDYLAVVRAYADAMIEKGRDRYGAEHSPLFAAALDREVIGVPEGSRKERLLKSNPPGIRSGDRILSGANPMTDQNLYQTLYALSEVTGERRYAAEADAALAWFFEHCQSPATGLMAWGEHMGWDFATEQPIRDIHEFARPWLLWDPCYRLAPEACRRFAVGLWEHQIADHRTAAFSRHAHYAKHGPGKGYEFPRHGGFYIATWAAGYEHTKDPVMLEAINTLVDAFAARRHPETGAINAETRTPELCWPPSNLSLAIDVAGSAPRVPAELGAKMRRLAADIDRSFFKCGHDLSPGGKGFLTRAVTSTLEPGAARADDGSYFTRPWSSSYGHYVDAQVAMLCLLRYQQTQDPAYKRLFVGAADRYLAADPDRSASIWPGALGDAIALLVQTWHATGEEKYLDRADHFGRLALELFFTDGSPLPKASSKQDHYESITRGDTLMMELLALWAAQQRRPLQHTLVWPDR